MRFQNPKKALKIIGVVTFLMFMYNCSSDDDSGVDSSDDMVDVSDDDVDEGGITELSSAFDEFNEDAVTITLSDDGTEINIETTGLPDHESVYWGEDHELYRDEPLVTTTPNSLLGGGGNDASFIVDATPDLTGNAVATGLGTIGIAVSGASIFNDQEGSGDLDQAAATLDFNGGHKGGGAYHYHLEPTSISQDDSELVGILMDGVFIYGRRDYPSNEYPEDLDESGGHFGPTPHNAEGEYHYHIKNELLLIENYAYDEAIVIFGGDFLGF